MGDLFQAAGWLLMFIGTGFLISGAVGLVRFPDLPARLHAVTKADTVGLGFLVAGLVCHADTWRTTTMLLLIWCLVMASGAVACQLLARYHLTDSSRDLAASQLDYGADSDDR